LKFIISKSNGENFERDKVFESEKTESAYNYLNNNADNGRLVSLDALKRDLEFVSDMRPMYGFYIKEDCDDVLYMKVEK
jgi:hypothetical protein